MKWGVGGYYPWSLFLFNLFAIILDFFFHFFIFLFFVITCLISVWFVHTCSEGISVLECFHFLFDFFLLSFILSSTVLQSVFTAALKGVLRKYQVNTIYFSSSFSFYLVFATDVLFSCFLLSFIFSFVCLLYSILFSDLSSVLYSVLSFSPFSFLRSICVSIFQLSAKNDP